jgi:hypothetical protein
MGVNGSSLSMLRPISFRVHRISFFDERVVLVMNRTGIFDERRRPIAASEPGMTRLSSYATPASVTKYASGSDK